MALLSSTSTARGEESTPSWPSDYPLLPGGYDRMAKTDFVIAPHRIIDTERECIAYGTGERVPMADAIKYGLVVGPAASVEGEKAKEAQEKTAVQRRGRRKGEDRQRPQGEDR